MAENKEQNVDVKEECHEQNAEKHECCEKKGEKKCGGRKEKILEKNMKDELREYAQYEVLKKKFENYNPKEKYGIE